MIDKDVALDALSALCHANLTSVQKVRSESGYGAAAFGGGVGQQRLFVNNFISTSLDADDTCQVSRSSFVRLQSRVEGVDPPPGYFGVDEVDAPPAGRSFIIDEDEFFDPTYDYDFTKLRDTETYRRGGEVYERPCGWQRFALRVLNKYPDGNTWLGNRYRSTKSVPGEWPVSYHGTSQQGAAGIIQGFYQAQDRNLAGVYSTPYISEAIQYAKTFIHKKTGKRYKVILQNRINPMFRQTHGKYFLVPIPAGTSKANEQQLVEQAIRPYGPLLKAI